MSESMEKAKAALGIVREGLQDPFSSLEVGLLDHTALCFRICELHADNTAFYSAWEAAEHYGRYINRKVYADAVALDNTFTNPEWMEVADRSIGLDIAKLCQVVTRANVKYEQFPSFDLRDLYILFTTQALTTEAILGHETDSRPYLYMSPEEIAAWRRDNPSLSLERFRHIICVNRKLKVLIPKILGTLAIDPEGQ